MAFATGTPTQLVELDGEIYEIGFTINAMKRAQDLGVLDVDTSDGSAFMRAMPEYLWACMDDDGRAKLSVKQIGDLLNPNNIQPIIKAVGDLFLASLPKPDVKDEPGAAKTPTPGNSTSTNSGHLVSTT